MNAKLRMFGVRWILVMVGAAFCGCEWTPAPPIAKSEPPLEVNAVHPHRGEIYRFVTLPGEVHPLLQVTLFTKVGGYLKTLTVDKGDSVKAGDLIADIEVPELMAERTRHSAELELASAEFRQISETKTKEADAAAIPAGNETGSRHAIAKGKLAVAKANLRYTETMLNYARITAPFDGVVTRRFVDPGAFIPAPNAADTPESASIVDLTDFKTLRMQVAVPETEVPYIALGQPVRFTTDNLPGQHFDGSITRSYWALDRHTKTMLTEVQMPNPKMALRPGMLVSARIGLERKDDALLVPVAALVMEKANAFVFIHVAGKARKVPVRTSFNDGTNVEITSDMKLEDLVIVEGQQTLRDDQPVNLKEAK